MATFSNCLQIVNNMPQQDQDALLARLDELQAQGMSPAEAQLQAAIDVLAQVEREGQIRKSADRVTDTPKFKRWSGNAPLVEMGDAYEYRSGQPVVVEALHGTTNPDLEEFSRERANVESDWGAGFYASNTPDDVAINYANNAGPDLTNRIELTAERLEDDFDGDMEAARTEARRRLSGEAPNTLKLYVRFKNPAVLGGKGETYFDISEEFDEETEEYTGEVSGLLWDFVQALEGAGDGVDVAVRDLESVKDKLLEAAEGNGLKFGELARIVKDNLVDAYDVNTGDSAGSEMLRQALAGMGFDGVIDTTVSSKFKNMKGMDDDTVHFIAFEPEQLKSATGNNGEFGEVGSILRSVDRPQFYSQLQRSIEQVPDRLSTMAAPAWKQWLTANAPKLGVKADEVEWSGIKDYLDLQGKAKLSKDDLVRYLDESGVQIGEVTLGGPDEDQQRVAVHDARDKAAAKLFTGDDTYIDGKRVFDDELGYMLLDGDLRIDQLPQEKQAAASEWTAAYNKLQNFSPVAHAKDKYGRYTLPGGENYRELLITLPAKREANKLIARETPYGYWEAWNSTTEESELEGSESEIRDYVAETMKNLEGTKAAVGYQSSHWDQKNVLAHIRVNDRTDADGKRVLFVEEVQSDWGQEGLKKGFQLSDAEIKANGEKSIELRKKIIELRKQGVQAPDDGTPESEVDPKFLELQSLLQQENDLREKSNFYRGLPPSAPFVKKTEGWLNLALKRIAMMAVEGGYDKVAFVNGEQSADRYDLSKSIESIGYDPKTGTLEAYDKNRNQVTKQSGVSNDDLEDHIGKDVAKRLLDQPLVMGKHLLEGQDIKVGGKGMIKFYDEIVPQALSKLLPKIGGEKLGAVTIGGNDKLRKVRDDDGTYALEEKRFDEYDEPYWEAIAFGLTEQRAAEVMQEDKRSQQPGFDVTDKMRETVGQGLPLFSRDRFVEAEESELYQKRTAKDVGLISDKDAMAALQTDATSVRIMDKGYQVKPGELVGARLNLNVLKNTKVPVMTLHKATNTDGYKNNRGFYRGEAVQYQPAVTLRNAYFNVDQTGRENIATGTQNKFPMASVDGEYVDAEPNFDGVEVSFNPMRVHLFVDANGYPVRSAEEISMFGTRAYARGKIEYYTKETAPNRKGEAPSEVKLSRDRPWFDDLSKLKVSTNYQLGDLLKTSKKLSWWNRTIGTQYDLAQKHPQFKRVFDAVQTFLNDVSAYATRAADLAPTILPKLETWKDIGKSPLSAADVKALRDPIFGGTLKYTRDDEGNIIETEDVSTAGVVFKDEELRDMFGLNDRQIGLYREFRRATNKSLSDLAVSDMLRYLGTDGEGVRQRALAASNLDGALNAMVAHLDQLIEQQPQRAEVLEDTKRAIKEKAGQAIGLMARGYAPLSRFGQYTVYAVGADGEQLYFSMFENDKDAQRMKREMEEQYPDATVTTGTMSQESYKLFSGVTPETLALFGESLGLEESGIDAKSEVFQQYLKMAKTNRSAMKRLIQRKGIDGFSEDAGRVLAGFVYSNARQISTNLHAGEISRSAAAVTDGDVKDAAIRLMEYVQNPREEAQAIRGLLFTQFIGGSIASAMVNMTQPFTMTLPYLAQFDGIAGASKRMADAVTLVSRGIRNDDDLKEALKRGEELSIVSPQEVHQLMAQAQGKGALQSGDGTKAGDAAAKVNNAMAKLGMAWGKVFSAAEQFNRRVTFIAAYKMARDQGMPDPMTFAQKAIAETQGVYNKGNKPAWARGAIGGTLFTFKQFSIGYLEFLRRMWGNGPEGKKAVGLALAVLFLSAGLGGMPGADDLDDVIDGFAQRVLGMSFDSKQAKKQFFASLLGQSGAEFVMSGLTGLPGMPIDLSGRMGLGNLIPSTGILTKKQNYGQDIAEFFGPAGTMGKQLLTSGASLAQGDLTKTVTGLAPVAAQNWIKAFDMASMGMYRDQRGRKVIDTNGWEAMAKAIGFQPSSVKAVQEATSTQQNLIAQNRVREQEIADLWTAGRVERDPGKVDKAKAQLKDWNESNPESPIRIDPSQINRRVQQAMMDKAQRIEKTAPKEIRASVKKELDRSLVD